MLSSKSFATIGRSRAFGISTALPATTPAGNCRNVLAMNAVDRPHGELARRCRASISLAVNMRRTHTCASASVIEDSNSKPRRSALAMISRVRRKASQRNLLVLGANNHDYVSALREERRQDCRPYLDARHGISFRLLRLLREELAEVSH